MSRLGLTTLAGYIWALNRHGIFRYWDVANQNNPRLRQKPEVDSVQDLRNAGSRQVLTWL